MRQVLQYLRSGEIVVEEVPAPICRQGGVVVRNRYSVVSSGTERSAVEFARHGLLGKARARPDLVRQIMSKVRTEGLLNTYKAAVNRLEQSTSLGYSSCGYVVELGDGVDHVAVGDAVACAGTGYAAHSEFVFVPRNLCVKVPGSITPRQGSFCTIGAIALQGVRRAELTPGERVGVIGLGLIGQITVQLLNAYGFPVIGFDVNRERVEAAKRTCGIPAEVIGGEDVQAFSSGHTDGVGLDAVIVTAATKSNDPVELAGRLLRERGRVVIVGDVRMDIPRRVYYGRELDVRVSRSYGPGRYDASYEEHGIDYPLAYARWTEQRNMQEFLRLLELGRVFVDPLVTHVFPVERARDAYELIVDNPHHERFLGVLIEYPQGTDPPRRVYLAGSQSRASRAPSAVTRIGLIGAGTFATGTIVPCVRAVPNTEIRAVSSAGGVNAKSLGKRLRAGMVTTDYKEIVNSPDIDLIIAATRHNISTAIAVDALKAGKAVHVEKPLAITMEGFKAVADAAATSTGILMVGFNRRFAPCTQRARDHFDGRSTPLAMFYRVNAGFVPPEHWVHDPVEGGGRILGEVCHFVDLLHFLADARPVKVWASRLKPSGSNVLPDDNVSATIEFADGSVGTILYSALGADSLTKERIEIMGDGRSVVIDNFRRIELYRGSVREVVSCNMDKGHRRQFAELVSAVSRAAPSPIPIKDLLYSTLATFCIGESLRSGKPVQVEIDEALAVRGSLT